MVVLHEKHVAVNSQPLTPRTLMTAVRTRDLLLTMQTIYHWADIHGLILHGLILLKDSRGRVGYDSNFFEKDNDEQ